MKIPSSNLGRTFYVQKLFLTFRTIYVHNMFSPMFWKKKSFWQRFTCTDKFNEVEERISDSSGTLEDCMFNCKDDCRYWTYNKTSEDCFYSKIMINKHDISGPEIVTGSQHCKSSTLYFPHCAELNTNYTDVVSRKQTVFYELPYFLK